MPKEMSKRTKIEKIILQKLVKIFLAINLFKKQKIIIFVKHIRVDK